MFVRRCLVTAFAIVVALVVQHAFAFPVDGDQATLPAGSELNEDALDLPREVFHSEAVGGRRSHLVNLGDMAFNAPSLLGDKARQAGISCGTCHVNGASNPKLFIPGASTRPGNFDTSGSLFNPKANNLALDAVRIPSLRGARYLAPYGNDGRMASLRDFVRNVIVVEFAGPEPSPAILDSLVAYIQDIDFLPNPSLGPGGKLTAEANDAERRGEALFRKPFPHDPNLSCAGCHDPSTAFLDHKQHDVGTGGLYKTPTLLNADFNAPYFHDGRYDTYDQVAAARLQEISGFVSVLAKAIPEHDNDTIDLVVDTVGGELRELTERVPDRKNTIVSGGVKQRNLARMALKEVVLTLRRIGINAESGNYDAATAEYRTYNRLMNAAVPTIVSTAEPWSLFNPMVHDAHYAALRRLMQSDKQPSQQAN